MKEHGNRRRGIVAVVLSAAAVAVALPVSGALAGAETAPTQAQEPAPRDDSQRNHGDCPDNDGRGASGSDASVEL
jgi:hypothetical protein